MLLDTSFHASLPHSTANRIFIDFTISDEFVYPSALKHTYWMRCFLYFTFQLAIIQASSGWVLDIVFLGKNTTLILQNIPSRLGG